MKTFLVLLMSSVLCMAVATAQDMVSTSSITTTVQFEEPLFNFGKIEQGEKIMNVFKFINTGTEPYLITNAKGSCGCTVPKFPKEPIMPGETGELHVRFDSKGKSGAQSKRVTLTGNTETANIYLTIKGEILVAEDKSKESKTLQSVAVEQVTKESKPFHAKEMAIDGFSISPNPSAEYIEVTLSAGAGERAQLNIFNIDGKMVDQKLVNEISTDPLKFSVAELPEGSYVLSLKVDGYHRLAKQFKVLH